MSILAKIFKKKEKISNIENQEILIQTPLRNQKILIISDIHFPLSEKETDIINKEYDTCLLLGDIPKDILLSLNTKTMCRFYGVCGNHDTEDSLNNINGIENIHNIQINEKQYSLTGISGSSKYKEHTPYCMLSQEESLTISQNLPKCDILISHDSPYQIHSTSMNKEGLKGITEYIKKNKPKLHIYGHHHITKSYVLDETLCICNYRVGYIDIDGIYHTV